MQAEIPLWRCREGESTLRNGCCLLQTLNMWAHAPLWEWKLKMCIEHRLYSSPQVSKDVICTFQNWNSFCTLRLSTAFPPPSVVFLGCSNAVMVFSGIFSSVKSQVFELRHKMYELVNRLLMGLSGEGDCISMQCLIYAIFGALTLGQSRGLVLIGQDMLRNVTLSFGLVRF